MPSPAPTEETFRRGTHLAALERLVKMRIYLAPIIGSLAATFAFFEASAWRRWLLGAVITVLSVVSYVEWLRLRRYGPDAVNLPFNFLLMLAAQLSVITATGGLFSPIMPAVIVMCFLGAVLLYPGSYRRIATLLLPAFWALAFVHARFGLVPTLYGDAGSLEGGIAPWLAATVYSGMVFAAALVGTTVRGAMTRLFTDAVDARDRRLAGYAEQTSALSALSAEIAHELKNPLSSVKGLGALVAKDVTGKPAERVAVLRREVDRMQDILEELLNFSRPLVPLSMEEVDASALAEDVVRMHEGSAVDRGVSFEVRAQPATLTCDPRKVRQVLVNLVQNALQASPRGGRVTIEVRGDAEQVRFDIDDVGGGLDPEVRARIFEAGVTTKENGSGIGLVVARSLARQHGGELRIEDREPTGCRATLTLPRTPEGAS